MGDELVECHSGYAYAERPVAFYWQGERLDVERIENEWRAPEGKHFRVRVYNGQTFKLVYNEGLNTWQIHPE